MSAPLDFYLITDLHHYAHSLGITGEAYEKKNQREQLCLAETGPIIDAYIDKILEDKETKFVLVAGDVSNNGAMESHLDLIPRLKKLKDAGKRIFLITATHDYYVEGNDVGKPVKLVGAEEIPVEHTQNSLLTFITNSALMRLSPFTRKATHIVLSSRKVTDFFVLMMTATEHSAVTVKTKRIGFSGKLIKPKRTANTFSV